MKLSDIRGILLLGTDDANALSAIRAIGTALPYTAIYTLSAETDTFQISNYSRYVTRHYVLKAAEGEEFVHEITGIIKDTGVDVLLPVNERSVRLVSEHREKLTQCVKLPPLPDVNLFDTVVSKDRLAQILQSNSLPVPDTYPLAVTDTGALSNDQFPFLIKPIRGSGGNNVQKIEDPAELEKILSEIRTEDFILQEFIPGDDIDCSLLAVSGEIKAYTIQRGLSNSGFSFSTAIRFENHPKLYQQVERFVRAMNYSGVAHLDFRLDSRDGLPKLVDFNARFWSSMDGSKAAGVDFTLLCIKEALEISYSRPVFMPCSYFMGRSTFRRFKHLIHSTNGYGPSYSDLKNRITDPLPELLRYC